MTAGTQIPTVLRIFEGDFVVTPYTVVARRPSQPEAITVACARLAAKAGMFPDMPWRMRVNRTPDDRWPEAPWAVTAVWS